MLRNMCVYILVVKNFQVRIEWLTTFTHFTVSVIYSDSFQTRYNNGHIELHCRERVKQIIISCPQDAIMNKGKQTRAQAVC